MELSFFLRVFDPSFEKTQQQQKNKKPFRTTHRVKVRPEDLHARPRLLPRLPRRALGGGLPELQVTGRERPRPLPGLDGTLAQQHPRLNLFFAFLSCIEGVNVGDDGADDQQRVGVRDCAAAALVAVRGRRNARRAPASAAAYAGVPPPPFEPRDGQLPAAPGAPLLRRSHGRGLFTGGRDRGRVGEARV